MQNKILLIIIFLAIFVRISGSTNEIHANHDTNETTESVKEENNEEDQVYIKTDFIFATESTFIRIEIAPTYLQEYHKQIWKPPVNS